MEVVLKKSGAKVLIDTEDLHFCKALQRGRDGLVYSRWWEKKKQVRVGLHRLIMNAPKGLTVDHINGNTLDNRKKNLRLATPSQNSCNRNRPRMLLKHKYRGVAFFPRLTKNPWNARIKVKQKSIYIGYFPTIEKAALAYDKMALKHHGEFARLNFPRKEKA